MERGKWLTNQKAYSWLSHQARMSGGCPTYNRLDSCVTGSRKWYGVTLFLWPVLCLLPVVPNFARIKAPHLEFWNGSVQFLHRIIRRGTRSPRFLQGKCIPPTRPSAVAWHIHNRFRCLWSTYRMCVTPKISQWTLQRNSSLVMFPNRHWWHSSPRMFHRYMVGIVASPVSLRPPIANLKGSRWYQGNTKPGGGTSKCTRWRLRLTDMELEVIKCPKI